MSQRLSKPFWPPALVQQAPPAILLAALRRFRGPALFLGLRPCLRQGAPFWPSGLTLRSSGRLRRRLPWFVSFERLSMSAPKISLNKLGEYMNATPARRRRIIEDQIAPKDFVVARYTDARESIIDCIAGKISEDQLTQIAEDLREKEYESKFTAQDKNLSADAIDSFLEISDQLPDNHKFEKVPANEKSTIEIAGVDVSIRPDAYIKNDNDEVVGALKLHFPKSNPLDKNSGEYVATALKAFLQEGTENTIDHKLCIVVDVPSSSVIPAPKAGKKRMIDIEAACEEIGAQWRSKTS